MVNSKQQPRGINAPAAVDNNWLDHDHQDEGDDDQPPPPPIVTSPPPPPPPATVTADYSSDFEMTPSEVRVAAGTNAFLSCRPRSLRNKTVRLSIQRLCS